MKNNLLVVLCVLGIVLGVNIGLRCFPVFFPQLKNDAANTVEDKLYQDGARVISKKFSFLSDAAQQTLVKNYVREFKKNNREKIRKDKEDEYAKIKDQFQDKNAQTYLMELDCWHWARYVENVLKYGHPGDRIRNGKDFDNLMLAPEGSYMPWNTFLFYFSAFLYKVYSFVVSVDLYSFLFYLPLVFTAVLTIMVFVLSLRFYGLWAAAFASFFIGTGPILLPRSCAGWFDTDILNLLFPCIIVFFYFMAYEQKLFFRKAICVIFSGFFVGIFSSTWNYWCYIIAIVLLYEVYSALDLVSEYLQYKTPVLNSFREHGITALIFFCSSLVWILVFSGTTPIRVLFGGQLNQAISLNSAFESSIWPNVYFTVAELARPDFIAIMRSTGGVYLFFISLVSMLALVFLNKKFKGGSRELLFFMIIWFMLIFWLSSKGVRLLMFLLVPMGILLGAAIEELVSWVWSKNKKIMLAPLAVFLFVLIGFMFNNGYRSAANTFPLMDDMWHTVLSRIKQYTPPEAVINSWWDYGDWFKTVAQRKVIFDGQSQNTPQGYWMSRVLMERSEEKAMGILRMLNNGGNKAFDTINGYFKNPTRSVILLEKVLGLSQEQALESLSDELPEALTACVMELLYKMPAKAYFVVEYTMLSKMYQISYLGNWDFIKFYLTKNIETKTQEQLLPELKSFGIDEQTAKTLYQNASLLSGKQREAWISKRLRFLSQPVEGREKEGIVFFNNGLIYYPQQLFVSAYHPRQNGYGIPKSLFLFEENGLREIPFPDGNLDYSVLVYKEADKYMSMQLDNELARSLFTRLYFFTGKGLKHFSLFTEKVEDNRKIKVFEINWD
jgi:dolichyl-diphosphooligosaccharide--protein glycosyltransferase